MSEYDFVIERVRLHTVQKDILIFTGFFRDDNPQKRTLKVRVNGRETHVDYVIAEGSNVRSRYLHYQMNVGQEITGHVLLPRERIRNIVLLSCLDKKETEVYRLSETRYARLCKALDGNLDMKRVEDGQLILTGWCVAGKATDCSVSADRKEIPYEIRWKYRKDVQEAYPELGEDVCCGFELYIRDTGMRKLTLVFAEHDRRKRYQVYLSGLRKGGRGNAAELFRKLLDYLKRNGWRRTVRKIFRKLRGKGEAQDYSAFLKKYGVSEEALMRQRQEKPAYSPLCSIVVPLYRSKEHFLKELMRSVQNQTYENWEVCFADGSGRGYELQKLVEAYAGGDSRFKYRLLDENRGIAGNTNEALQMAEGEFIVLMDHDDLLSAEALYQCVKVINEQPDTEIIYSDEDKVDMSGRNFFEPHFKPDFNIDLLCSMNYICHLFVFRRDILEKTGGFDSRYDGAQDHDFILRCVEAAQHIVHIPKVLYHWRCHRQSTSANPESKSYAFENGCSAVQAHYNRLGIPAEVEQGPFYGMYRTRYRWEEEPLLSIIIPNKDHVEDLRKCLSSIEERSEYRNYEIVIVENNSIMPETFAYYEELKKRDNIQIVFYEGGFNFSRINNCGAAYARGEYFLLLNNDTELIEPGSIKEMLDVCMRKDVGAVGARLFFPDDTIQHAGVIIGFGGMAGHAFIGQDREDNGYFSRILCVQDLSAVTGACLMVRKSVFEKVGGLEEQFRVAFNDIDFCLKVRNAGYLVVYQPYAQFYHFESKSRGQEDSADKVARFQEETALFVKRWEDILIKGDPYYNPNLTLDKADFSLKQ